ncbi:MAG TPA: methyltransferase, partial [Verrucomicrobiae bacterium]
MTMQAATHRSRLQAALDHTHIDEVPMDFGGTAVTGIHVSAVSRLRQRVLGDKDYRVRVTEPYQMLGEVDDALREALGIDVVGVPARRSMFGTEGKNWKPFRLFDGTECLVPGEFNVTPAPDGGWLIYPEGDTGVRPSGHMPQGGYFFDAIIRQDPIHEDQLNPEDNLEEFGLLGEADLAYYRQKRDWLRQHPNCGC